MPSAVRVYIGLFLVTFVAATLGGCNDGTSGGNGAPVGASPTAAAAVSGLTISGSPASSVAAGSNYSFRPTASSAAGAGLTFAINNAPGWARFDPATGTVTGTPTTAYIGSSAPIVITVSDGSSTAALAAFSIEVMQAGAGEAALSWTAPSAGEKGTEVAGYHIYYGESSAHLTHVIDVSDSNSTNFVVNHLRSGTWYFAIKTYNNSDTESNLSAIVAVTI
jgi:hypothetical protein